MRRGKTWQNWENRNLEIGNLKAESPCRMCRASGCEQAQALQKKRSRMVRQPCWHTPETSQTSERGALLRVNFLANGRSAAPRFGHSYESRGDFGWLWGAPVKRRRRRRLRVVEDDRTNNPVVRAKAVSRSACHRTPRHALNIRYMVESSSPGWGDGTTSEFAAKAYGA